MRLIRSVVVSCLCLVFGQLAVPAVVLAEETDLPRDSGGIPFNPDWTPRPVEGAEVPWYMQETDKDWVDGRLQEMDTGRTFNATFRYRHGDRELRALKGTAVRLGDRGEAAMLFDRNQLRWACGWTCEPFAERSEDPPTGFTPYLEHSDRRFGLLNTPAPQGELVFTTGSGCGLTSGEGTWSADVPASGSLPGEWGGFGGLYRLGTRTAIYYRAGEDAIADEGDAEPVDPGWIVEFPWAFARDEGTIFTRSIQVQDDLDRRLMILETTGHPVGIESRGRVSVARVQTAAGQTTWVAVVPAHDGESAELEDRDGRLSIDGVSCLVCLASGEGFTADRLAEIATGLMESEHPDELLEKLRVQQSGEASASDEVESHRSEPEWPEEIITNGESAEETDAYVIDTITVPYDNPYGALMFLSGVDFVPKSFVEGWWPTRKAVEAAGASGAAVEDLEDVLVVTTAHGDVWLVGGVDASLANVRWKRFATGLYQPMGVRYFDGELYVLERGQITILKDTDGNGEADVYKAFNMGAHVTGGEHSYHTSLEQDLEGNFYFHAGGDTDGPTGGTLMQISRDGRRLRVYATGFRHPIGLGVLPDGRITGADQEGNWMPATRIDIYKPGGFYGDMRAHHRGVDPTTFDGPLCWLPRELAVGRGGIRLRFTDPLVPRDGDLKTLPATDPRRYHVEQWNYVWSGEYGSKRYSVRRPGEVGQDELTVSGVTLIEPDTVFLSIDDLRPAMQTLIEFDIAAYPEARQENEQRLRGAIYSTIHTPGPATELRDGERIALIGSTLVEREQRYGYWEHALTTADPDKRISVRNLGWSGDTVWAESRGIFDPPAKGYERLVEQVGQLRPTLLVLNYGGNEAWAGEAGLEAFITQYDKLIDDLVRAATSAERAKAESGGLPMKELPVRVVLLAPLPMEPGSGPNADPSEYNRLLERYTSAIEDLAQRRSIPFIDLAEVYTWHGEASERVSGTPAGSSGESDGDADGEGLLRAPLTENGLHLSEYGYWRTAPWFCERLIGGEPLPAVVPTAEDARALESHFDPVSKRVRIDPIDRDSESVETLVLEYKARLSRLPLPPLGETPAPTARQTFYPVSPGNYRLEVDSVAAARGDAANWYDGIEPAAGPDVDQSLALLQAIRRKNELYFHRWRPQNITYLLLFRKHEQGNNAVEIPQFDPLVAEEEERIDELKRPKERTYRLIREASSGE